MIAFAIIALFAAVAPAEEVVEDLETLEFVLSEESDGLVYEDLEYLEEIVLEDNASEDIFSEDAIVFDEE